MGRDNPLSPTAACTTEAVGAETTCASEAFVPPGYDVANFHRIVVHGSTFPLEWLKLTVSPDPNYAPSSNAFGPFTWHRTTQSS